MENEQEQEQQMTDQQERDSIMQNDVSSSDDFTIVNEEDLVFVRRTKKPEVKLYFDGGTYLTNYPHHRDGWTKADWDFYASLVRMKVARNTRKDKLTVLDDIKEFRMIPTKEANELCQYLYDTDLLFVVYEGDEIKRKSLGN